jgi:hypothetical protein
VPPHNIPHQADVVVEAADPVVVVAADLVVVAGNQHMEVVAELLEEVAPMGE